MDHQNSQIRVKPSRVKNKKTRHLRGHHLFILKIVGTLIRLWARTLRFQFGPEVRTLLESAPPPFVSVVWHNRLFVVPEFYRRYAGDRKLAAIVSASSAGAWLSGLLEQMDIQPIRGSRNRRGAQAFREMIKANRSGYDLGITPDGSRGPLYEMKPGAVAVAQRTGAPIVLISYNFQQALRLKTWDRFYIPWPFSIVEVKMDMIEKDHELLGFDANQAAGVLKIRLDAMTEEIQDDFSGEVI
jgi:lysophospholipid acyltransferase (LPLAT)-like uncharacterized protein